MTTTVETKPVQKSKTIIFNILAFAAMLLPLIETWTGSTSLTIPMWVAEVLALAIPVVNLFLRFVTDQPVSMTLEPTTAQVKAPGAGVR